MKVLQSGTLTGASGSTAAVDISKFMRTGFMLALKGTFDGASVVVHMLDEDGEYFNVNDPNGNQLLMTSNGAFFFDAIGASIRLNFYGATNADIDYTLFH